MGYFDELIDGALLERMLTVRGKSKATYWRQLSAGEKLQLLRGQVVKFERTADGAGAQQAVQEVQLEQSLERRQRLVQMTLCQADGKLVYATLKDLQREPAWLIDALADLADSLQREADAEKS